MIKLTQNEIVDLFVDKMKLHGPSNSGTYNKADPTHYEKGTATLGLANGFKPIDDDDFVDVDDSGAHVSRHGPGPENVTVHWHDVTWGVEFEITTSAGVEKAYWSRPVHGCEGEWLRTGENFFVVFKRILIEGQDEDFWSKNDDLAAMGYYSCK